MTGVFANATAVRRISTNDSSAGETVTTFVSEVQPGWDIGGNANGGYLMAIAGRAMSEAVGRPPATLTAHYLRPAPIGHCEVVVTTVRSGRRFATATGSLVMFDGDERREIIRLLGTFGEQTPGGPSFNSEDPVDIPNYDECELPPTPTEGPKPAMMERLASRIYPGDEGFRNAAPTGTRASGAGSRSPIMLRSMRSVCCSPPMRSRRRCSTRTFPWHGCRRSS